MNSEVSDNSLTRKVRQSLSNTQFYVPIKAVHDFEDGTKGGRSSSRRKDLTGGWYEGRHARRGPNLVRRYCTAATVAVVVFVVGVLVTLCVTNSK